MKYFMMLFVFLTCTLNAQEFKVEKISGKVQLLKETSEKLEKVSIGQVLSNTDLVITEENSLVQLAKGKEKFLLNGNAAIGLNYVKKVSINDLILALALDEIRNVPKTKRNGISKNTAVYGKEVSVNKKLNTTDNVLGIKKLNGAKILSKNGYVESSIIVAREVFRNYPSTATNFEDRLYFADLLDKLELYQEAASEYSNIEKLTLSDEQKSTIVKRKEAASFNLMEK